MGPSTNSLLILATMTVLVALGSQSVDAALYENQEVCGHFLYQPFRKVDHCLSCCQQAGYTQKGNQVSEGNGPCTCQTEKAKPDQDDVLIASTYENGGVCGHFQYQPFRKVDHCLNCCKQAGYVEKGKEATDGHGQCICKGQREKPDIDDVLVAGPAGLVVYENKNICTNLNHDETKKQDTCLPCCLSKGYQSKGLPSSIGFCTCRAAKSKPGSLDYNPQQVEKRDPIIFNLIDSNPRRLTVYQNEEVCKQYMWIRTNFNDPRDYCEECCLQKGYQKKGILWAVDENGPCTCQGPKEKPDKNDYSPNKTTYYHAIRS